MKFYSSIGEAIGAAMKHNARQTEEAEQARAIEAEARARADGHTEEAK